MPRRRQGKRRRRMMSELWPMPETVIALRVDINGNVEPYVYKRLAGKWPEDTPVVVVAREQWDAMVKEITAWRAWDELFDDNT